MTCRWVSFNQVHSPFATLTRVVVLSFVGSTGSTTISFILPGLFFWKVGKWVLQFIVVDGLPFQQLTKDDPSASKTLNRAAFALTIYGVLVFVFWFVSYDHYLSLGTDEVLV